MAILHRATLTPSKPELLTSWLDRQPWGGTGEITVVGTYRLDDPAGEVGVEAFIVRRGASLVHVALTYRGAPLVGAEAHLVGTMEHSVLGRRWVYDAAADPVALACFEGALTAQQEQARLEVYDGDELVERRELDVRLERRGDTASPTEGLRIATVLGELSDGRDQLVAIWADGEAVVATR
ncbi:CG0192-related protein [Nocardioides pacificus]